MSRVIILPAPEYRWAVERGVMRNTESEISGRRPGWKFENRLNSYWHHINAAAAELAWAMYLGVQWDATVNNFRGDAPDVTGPNGECYEVRFSNGWPFLKVKSDDPDDYIVVGLKRLADDPSQRRKLVIAFEIQGMIVAREAKREEYWRDPGGRGAPCYAIPEAVLTVPDGGPPFFWEAFNHA